MLDIKVLRENPEKAQKALDRRHGGWSIEEAVSLDKKMREILAEAESLRRRSNEIDEAFKSSSNEEKNQLKEEKKTIKAKQAEIEPALKEIQEKLDVVLLSIPNIPADDVPDGPDETANVEVKVWGEIPKIADPKHHADLGVELGILDFERGVKLAQTRFVALVDMGAKMERALMNFMLDLHGAKGYVECFPPILVNRECMIGTGQLPKFIGDFYKVEDEELYLIPTSEVPITNLYRNDILDEETLPIYHTSYTPNFRKEAGAAGKDTRGYIRMHQFNKVELVKFVVPETSEDEHEKMTRDAEAILEALELPYRRVLLCAGDMGFSAKKCYDLEVWFPAQNKYREISSCSNFGDFQARRANLKYRPTEAGKQRHLHTLNGSGLAIGRTLAAIMENYQQPDGSVKVPGVLVSYLGGATYIRPKKKEANSPVGSRS